MKKVMLNKKFSKALHNMAEEIRKNPCVMDMIGWKKVGKFLNKHNPSIKIVVDFGGGLKRKYTLVDYASQVDKKCHWQIEFCHPKFGEIFIARKEELEK